MFTRLLESEFSSSADLWFKIVSFLGVIIWAPIPVSKNLLKMLLTYYCQPLLSNIFRNINLSYAGIFKSLKQKALEREKNELGNKCSTSQKVVNPFLEEKEATKISKLDVAMDALTAFTVKRNLSREYNLVDL